MPYMRAIRQDSPARRLAVGNSRPAPTGGWNARDNITEMNPKDAIVLDNWFPADDRVDMRKGHESYATGLGDQVETLFSYNGLTGDQLFAAAGGSIYDVSSTGAVGAAASSGHSNDRWNYENFETSGGNFIVAVNGADTPLKYDGSSWATTAITGSGLTATNLITLNVFKERIFLIEKNTLNYWYLPVNSIAGTASKGTLGAVAKKGGYLMAMGTWTFDGGAGIDDYAIFVTSKGEAIVYQGTDPSSPNTWALVGVFTIGSPIGRRCMFKVGGELVIITIDGFELISEALGNARTKTSGSYSDRIRKAVRTAAKSYSANFGWQPILYPRGGMGIFNVPIKEGIEAHQYVVNTNTGAWSRFKGQNANCWALYNDDLYFGGNGSVYKADTGTDDAGANITFDMETAFSHDRHRGVRKRYTLLRPILTTEGTSPGVALALNTDYERNSPLSSPTFSGSNGSPWDTSAWDTSAWSRGEGILAEWKNIKGSGYSASIRMKIVTGIVPVSVNSFDILYETGGFI